MARARSRSDASLNNRYGVTQFYHGAVSQDGKTFSAPRETGMQGETAKIITLANGNVLCIYRRLDQPGQVPAHARQRIGCQQLLFSAGEERRHQRHHCVIAGLWKGRRRQPPLPAATPAAMPQISG